MSISLRGITVVGRTISSVAAAPVEADQYFPNVTLLMTVPGAASSKNNTFLDSSTNNFTISRSGNTTQGTFTPYSLANWSTYYSSGNSQNLPVDTGLQLGTSNFTIEFWINADNFATSPVPIGNALNATNANWQLSISTAGIFSFTGWFASYLASSVAIKAGQWNHIAVVRDGATALALFVNGTRTALNTTDNPNFSSTNALWLGRTPANGNVLSGYMSNVRVVKGTAVYATSSTTITVPTSPLTAVTNTTLLMNQNRKFQDNSTSALAITTTGIPRVSNFSPFAPSAAWSAATYGGSGYFDGTGDNLQTPATGQFAPTGDFTIGAWIYANTSGSGKAVIANYTTASLTTDWAIEVNSSNGVQLVNEGALKITSATQVAKPGQWHYVAVTRSGSTITLWLNGASMGTTTYSGTFGSATKLIRIGAEGSPASALFNGYISSVRLVDGTAVTIVPSAPSTAVSGTSLLLNFTNAAIIDASCRSVFETVADAQSSTTQVKYGNSLGLDGTGDWLKGLIDPIYNFGPGDFTVEYWVYMSALNTYSVPISYGGVTTPSGGDIAGWSPWTGYGGTPGQLGFNTNTTSLGPFNTLSTGAWYHIAFTRSGTSVRCFVNGTQQGSTTTNSIDMNNSAVPLNIGAGHSNGTPLNGYLNNVRVTRGIARYTANFTAPVAAFPVQ